MKLTNAEKSSRFISTIFAILFAVYMESVTCKWSLLSVKTRCQLMSICQQCFQLLYYGCSEPEVLLSDERTVGLDITDFAR